MSDGLPASAKCGKGTLPGACWRPGDPNKHLGPPEELKIPVWSKRWMTRCGLQHDEGNWRYQKWSENDDCWCPGCLLCAGIPYAMYMDDV